MSKCEYIGLIGFIYISPRVSSGIGLLVGISLLLVPIIVAINSKD